jgi:hypothetical protein
MPWITILLNVLSPTLHEKPAAVYVSNGAFSHGALHAGDPINSIVISAAAIPKRRVFIPQQLYLFCHKVNVEQANTCCVATGPIKAGNETELDWIAAGREEDRNSLGYRLRGERNSGTTTRDNYCHPMIANQIGDHRFQSIEIALCRAEFERDVTTLHVSGIAQTVAKCSYVMESLVE